MKYWQVTGTVRLWGESIWVERAFEAEDENEAMELAIDWAVEATWDGQELEYKSDTLTASEETPEQRDQRERKDAAQMMARSGVPSLFAQEAHS